MRRLYLSALVVLILPLAGAQAAPPAGRNGQTFYLPHRYYPNYYAPFGGMYLPSPPTVLIQPAPYVAGSFNVPVPVAPVPVAPVPVWITPVHIQPIPVQPVNILGH
jgi:hypothetical protein